MTGPGGPPCLHKDHSEEWDITRVCDSIPVRLEPCGGVRMGPGECRSGNPDPEEGP